MPHRLQERFDGPPAWVSFQCRDGVSIADGSPLEVLRPYFLERTYGAPMEVLEHGGMPVVIDGNLGTFGRRLRERTAS